MTAQQWAALVAQYRQNTAAADRAWAAATRRLTAPTAQARPRLANIGTQMRPAKAKPTATSNQAPRPPGPRLPTPRPPTPAARIGMSAIVARYSGGTSNPSLIY